jgi:hypothetical protein
LGAAEAVELDATTGSERDERDDDTTEVCMTGPPE